MATPSKVEIDKVQKKLDGFLKKLNPDGSPKRPMLWQVVSHDVQKDKSGNPYLLCRCICGVEKLVFKPDLSRGKSTCCINCSRVNDPQKFLDIKKRHSLVGNLKDLPPYHIWRGIQQRCENANEPAYVNYGGRGIQLSDEWGDYLNFIDWSYTNGWQEGLTIERLDVHGNYSPDNCKWIPLKEQARNKRKYRNNKSGVTGVIETTDRWTCNWYDDEGRMKTKSFSKNKYTDEVAKSLAINFRDEQISRLKSLGIEYGEFHGM